MRHALITFLAFTLAAGGQQTGQNTSSSTNKSATFQTSTQLVVETVTVKDKSGNPVEGLTAKDFTVTEDGVPQSIRFFEFQKLEQPPDAVAAPEVASSLTTGRDLPQRLTHTQIAPESPGENRFKDHRLLALYFDMTAMPDADQLRALTAARKFIHTQMTPQDLMAIMMFSGGAVQVLRDFTADRALLDNTLEILMVGEAEGFDAAVTDASASDSGAAFGQDDGEFNIFNTDRQLAALQTAVKMLGQLNEKKSLIYFASGLRLNGANNQAQLHATINSAVRAGVSLYPIDARGLVAQAPLGDASKGSPGGIAMYTGGSFMAATTNFQRSQDTLYALAADTGGKALLDYNDLTKGIVQAANAVSSYYILGYYTSNTNEDGKF